MIGLCKLRELNLAERPHLSAASGLVQVGSFLYVVADDELHLGVFRADDHAPGHLIQIFEGELPSAKKERKKQKPDLETLTSLPPCERFPNGALLALGSGSKRHRRRSAALGLDQQGVLQGSPLLVDLSALFDPLESVFPGLNIEGAVVAGDELRLFQRGNKRNSQNAVIRFPLSPVLAALHGEPLSKIEPLAIQTIDLDRAGGIPFGFTDAATLPHGEVVFTAVAEDTDNSYDDGPCAAAAIGILDRDLQLRRLHRLDATYKIEGVAARLEGETISLLLVTDADDPAIPAALCSATITR